MNSKKIVPLLWAGYLLFVLYWIARFWGHFPAVMDTLEYVFPEKWFNVESFQKGLIPLWNPYLACGTPHVANLQSAFFYPFFWIWNFTGLTDWFFAAALAHGVLASVGFYFWLRALKVSPLAATLCSLSFGGSAYAILYWGFPTHLASMAWVPWIFWAALRLSQKFSRGRWTLLSLFWAFQILAGYPFFCFYTFLFLIFCLKFAWDVVFKNKLIQVSAFLAALALTACQWLPFVDFMGYMHREVWGGNLFSLQWINYLTLLRPDGLGIPGSGYQGEYANFIFSNFYLGLVPLAFLIWSFFSREPQIGFWRKALIFWLFWPLGIHFILWRFLPTSWLDKLEPSKASFLFLFCALTALGLFLRERTQNVSKKNFVHRFAWVWGALWILDLALGPFRMIHVVPDPYRDKEVQQYASKVRQSSGEGRIVSLREEGHHYSPAVKDFAGSLRETAEDLNANTNVVWGLKSAQGYLTTVVDGYQNFTSYLQKGYPYDGRVLDAAGVNVVLMPRKIQIFKYRVHELLGHLTLIHNPGAMNGAWQAGRAREFNSRPEVFAALISPKVFLENEVYLEKGSGGELVRLSSADRTLAEMDETSFWRGLRTGELFRNPAAAYLSRIAPCEARWDATAARPGYFVFDETFAPGWRAWVDGQPKHILRANGMWMTVSLSQTGKHQIVFRYQPLSFRLGLFMTLLTLAAFLVGSVMKPP